MVDLPRGPMYISAIGTVISQVNLQRVIHWRGSVLFSTNTAYLGALGGEVAAIHFLFTQLLLIVAYNATAHALA